MCWIWWNIMVIYGWQQTERNQFIYSPNLSVFAITTHSGGDYSSLPVNSITLLYKDMKDNLWAGSVRGGIFSIKETYIKTYKEAILNNTNGLSEQSVISLYEEKDGKVWIGNGWRRN